MKQTLLSAKYLFLISFIMGLAAVFGFPTLSGENSEKGELVKNAAGEIKNVTGEIKNATETASTRSDLPSRWRPWWREEGNVPPFGPGMGWGRGPGPFARDWMQSPERMENLRKENPELVDLIEETRRVDSDIRRNAEKYRKSKNADEKDQLSKKILDLLGNQFELEMRRQRLEIQIMENRLTRLKAALKLREENKDRLLNRQLQDFLENRVPPMPPLGGRGGDFRDFPPPVGRRGGGFGPPPPLEDELPPKP